MATYEENKDLSHDHSMKSLNSEEPSDQYQSMRKDHLPKLKLTPSVGPYIVVNSS